MTYQELAERINRMTEYQKGCNVTIKTPHDEYFGSVHIDFADVRTEDRLDAWHPYLLSKAWYTVP